MSLWSDIFVKFLSIDIPLPAAGQVSIWSGRQLSHRAQNLICEIGGAISGLTICLLRS